MSTTAPDPRAVARAQLEAFNDEDWDRFAELSHPDIVYTEAGTGRRIVGIEPYLEALREWKVALPDVRGDIRRAIGEGGTVAEDVLWRGTQDGPLGTAGGDIPPTGRSIEVSATLWVTVRDGRVADVEHHLDVLTLLAQIGVLGDGGD